MSRIMVWPFESKLEERARYVAMRTTRGQRRWRSGHGPRDTKGHGQGPSKRR